MNFTDYIYEDLKKRHDENLLTAKDISALKELRLYDIYSRVVKSDYMINELGDDINVAEVVALMLLHFKFITTEQFNKLHLTTDTRNLYNRAYRSKLGKGCYPIESIPCVGDIRAYVLKETGYAEIYRQLPKSYLEANRITPNYDRDRKVSEHNLMTLNTVYGTLSDEFPEFMWYPDIYLRYGLTVEKCLSMPMIPMKDRTSSQFFQPDGVMGFADGYVFIEQDMGTEKIDRLMDKNGKYGTFFAGNADAYKSTVLYNVTIQAKKKKAANASCTRNKSIREELGLVQEYCNGREIMDAYAAMIKDIKTGYMKRSRRMVLTSAIRHIGSWLKSEDGEAEFSGFEKYLKSFVKKTDEANRAEYLNRLTRRQMTTVRQAVLDVVKNKESRLYVAMLEGLSVVVTGDSDYLAEKKYLLPSISGICDRIRERFFQALLSDEYDPSDTYEYHPYGEIAESRLSVSRLKNRFDLKNTKGLKIAEFFIEEISADLGGFLRASHFLKICGRSEYARYIILLVSSTEEAQNFARSSKYISRFCNEYDPRRSNSNNLLVAFVDYVSEPDRIFALDEEGGKFYFNMEAEERAV